MGDNFNHFSPRLRNPGSVPGQGEDLFKFKITERIIRIGGAFVVGERVAARGRVERVDRRQQCVGVQAGAAGVVVDLNWGRLCEIIVDGSEKWAAAANLLLARMYPFEDDQKLCKKHKTWGAMAVHALQDLPRVEARDAPSTKAVAWRRVR